MFDLKEYARDFEKVLVVCSVPLDFDCVSSGLMMKKYLESLGKSVKVIHPAKPTQRDLNYHKFLPYFEEIEFVDTREVLDKNKFDLMVLVDGGNIWQFTDDSLMNVAPLDLSKVANRLHIDHHQKTSDPLGTETIHRIEVSSTAELVLLEIIPEEFIDEEIATLGYAGILGDTLNFRWNFFPTTFKMAAKLLEKEARAEEILQQMFFARSKRSLELLAWVIGHAEFNDELRTSFLFLSNEAIKEMALSNDEMDELKQIFKDEVAKVVEGYDRGVIVYEETKGKTKISARGNNLKNQINMPEMFNQMGASGGGHFNACGFSISGEFEEIREKIFSAIKSSLSL